MKRLLAIFVCCSALVVHAQFNDPVFIETTEECAGIEKIIGADMNNDGHEDIVVAQSYSVDQLSYYLNDGEDNFQNRMILDESINNPLSLASADFNNDGWEDLIAISNGDHGVYLYPNVFGSFVGEFMLDSLDSEPIEVLTWDHNDDGLIDAIVATTDYLIIYTNAGDYNYTSEVIDLDHGTIFSLSIDDMNNDGRADLIVGNDGVEVLHHMEDSYFETTYFQAESGPGIYLYTYDADTDGDLDILQYDGDLSLHLHINNGEMEYDVLSDVAPVSGHIESLCAMDINGDLILDIVAACYSKVFCLEGTGSGFEYEYPLYENESYFISEVTAVDIDEDNKPDIVWSGVSQAIAFQINESVVSVDEIEDTPLDLYPNPCINQFQLDVQGDFNCTIRSAVTGQIMDQIWNQRNRMSYSTEQLVAGVYLIEIISTDLKTNVTKKLIIRN